jgi:hypothetical protein
MGTGQGLDDGNLVDGTKVTVYFRKPQLRADGILPKGAIARFYGAPPGCTSREPSMRKFGRG